MENRTQGEWRLNKSGTIDTGKYSPIIATVNGIGGSFADGEFIIKAVNLHDELVAALEVSQTRIHALLMTTGVISASDAWKIVRGNNEINNALEKAKK